MMKRFANLLAVFILSVNCISAQNLTRWVNPFIGTGAVQSSLSGNNYPGATVSLFNAFIFLIILCVYPYLYLLKTNQILLCTHSIHAFF